MYVPSGGIHALSIFEACVGCSILMAFSISEVCRERWGLLLTRCHFPAGYQVNSRTYHLFFTLTFPPVDLSSPENMFIPFWVIFYCILCMGVGGGLHLKYW